MQMQSTNNTSRGLPGHAAHSGIQGTRQHNASMAGACSRRRFLCRTAISVTAIAALGVTPFNAVRAAPVTAQPADLELAALGRWLIDNQPELVTRLEAIANDALPSTLDQPIDLPSASAAKARLTQHQRVADELARGDFVFADGWLLSHSEAAATLLFALAVPAPAPAAALPANVQP